MQVHSDVGWQFQDARKPNRLEQRSLALIVTRSLGRAVTNGPTECLAQCSAQALAGTVVLLAKGRTEAKVTKVTMALAAH